MKKFILKTAAFILPFVLLSLFPMFFYSAAKGDLLRMGYLPDNSFDRTTIFKKEFERKSHFTNISDIDINAKSEYTALTIGDSFSEQGNTGYQDYLGEKGKATILHFDRFLHDNPIETLYGILNGDLLDNVKVKYIILESVEREFVSRSNRPDSTQLIRCNTLSKKIKNRRKFKVKESNEEQFFSKATFRFPLYNICYNFDDNAYFSKTYQVKTKRSLFSNSNPELLFFTADVEKVTTNNEMAYVAALNTELNSLSGKLRKKGITLIVLPCPDKYDLYYDFIVDKAQYPKPQFFEHLGKMPKDYLYVNSKEVLGTAAKTQKDIYFYDDTHWSPIASELIADELSKIIAKRK